jgi:SAM-dependent methyltransferase
MPEFDIEQVRHYYDRNTPTFVSLGQGGKLGALHRAVWGPGVHTRQDAFRYVENKLLERLRHLSPVSEVPHVVDLGCGVGGSLCYLAEHLPIRGTGITLSPVQARLASKRIKAAGLSKRIACLEGDYTALPTKLGHADLAYAIESFVHGQAPDQFFHECSQLVRPGGVLAICDDFRRPTSGPTSERAITRFCQGWKINALLKSNELHTLARQAGFEHESTLDLSQYLEIRRPRDRMIAALVSLLGWLPLDRTRLGHVIGGTALQECLAKGWIGYDLVLFKRND